MRIEVNGVRLFFDVEGAKLVPDGAVMREKPTLILLHGGPGDDHSFLRPEFSQLADACQVIFLDHRGNGRSDPDVAARWNLAQWGDDVWAFCEALQIESPIVLGISFGGFVAMSYATRHPEHPGKLILLSTSARNDAERKVAAFQRLGGAEAGDAARRAFGGEVSPEVYADFVRLCLPLYSKAGMDSSMALRAQRVTRRMAVAAHFNQPDGEFGTYDFLPMLGTVRCPTLVLAGEDDPACPIEDAEDLAAALPPDLVTFERIAEGRHGMFVEEPRVFDIIRKFILS